MIRQIFIEQLELRNILNCNHVHLNFVIPQSTYFIMTNHSNHNHHFNNYLEVHGKQSPISIAIQMICGAKFATIESLSKIEGIQYGSIRMRFLIKDHNQNVSEIVDLEECDDDDTPCTSKQAQEREARRKLREQHLKKSNNLFVEVRREFYNQPEHVSYSVNGGKYITTSIATFHERFFTTLEYVLPELSGCAKKCNGNWLQLLETDYYEFERYNNNPFNKFINLYLNQHYKQDYFMPRFTNSLLKSKCVMNLKQKNELLVILKSVRNTFEFITFEEYTVWFLIPCVDSIGFVNVHNLKLQDLDFKTMKTCIQLKMGKDQRRLFWKDVQHDIQDLLMIAFQIVLTVHCKENILFLSTFHSLRKHIAMQLTTAAFIEEEEQLRLNWTSQNYLQQIITACNKYKLTVIMDYNGGVPLPLGDANIVKCKCQADGTWCITNESAVMSNYIDDARDFLETINKDLSEY